MRFQNAPDRRGDSGYNVNRKRRTPRKCTRARAALFSVFVKCPGSDPRAFLFALSAQMPSTVRTARAPTDLKPNFIRVKKRDDERAHRREGGERVKEFQQLGTSDRVVGRPRTGCVAKPFYCERMHPQLVNAILTNICSIVTHTVPRPAELAALSGFARRVCVFKMSRIGGAIRDTIATGNDAPRVSDRKRGRPVSGVVKCPGL